MLILCDFDGTITLEDVTNVILDRFTGPGWRDTIIPRYRAGEISHLDVMQLCYAPLSTSLADLQAFYQGMPVRDNFERLVTYCREHQHRLAVVSGGLDFYIKDFLPPDLPFYCYLGEFDPAQNRWLVHLPEWPEVDPAKGQDFKVRVLEELGRDHPTQHPVVFIGNGRNDFPVAQRADYVFAVAGDRLAIMCAEAGVACTEFTDFAQVIARLQRLDRPEAGVKD